MKITPKVRKNFWGDFYYDAIRLYEHGGVQLYFIIILRETRSAAVSIDTMYT